MAVKTYDAVVLGAGCGLLIAEAAVDRGLRVALVNKGPPGGTCLNVGCIPSKMLIYPADRIVEIQEAARLGVAAEITNTDFRFIMARMRESVQASRDDIREGLGQMEGLDLYQGEGHFSSEYTVDVNGEELRGERVFIATGSRPLIPPIRGLDGVDYLTNETLLRLDEAPGSMIIIGGGYVAVEYGHFFSAMGTRVTILEMADRLLLAEEPEVSDVLKQELRRRMDVFTGTQAEEVSSHPNGVEVLVRESDTGRTRTFAAEALLLAVGRRSNADLLKPENTGVETDGRGFIKVDEYLESTRKNIFAVGDANGQQMFTHVANREAELAVHNAFEDDRLPMDYGAAPHAVYSHPQIASVGLTETSARERYEVAVGRARYSDVAKGEAMAEGSGFAKAVVEKGSRRILGFHIVGPCAPMLIQEVTNAMASGGHTESIEAALHIHPALSELVERTLGNVV